MAKKKILLNAFNMNCIGHINHGLWTHPRDTSTQYKTIEYWTELAKTLERGLFDGFFIALEELDGIPAGQVVGHDAALHVRQPRLTAGCRALGSSSSASANACA